MTKSVILPKGTCDVIKLIAALLVVTAHIGTVALGPAYNSDHWIFTAMATQSGYTGVAIFFFFSGFGLMESERKSHLSLHEFFRRRFMKIYLPVVMVTAIWMAITPLATYDSAFYTLLYGFADPVMWFVRVLIPLYALFYAASAFAVKTGWPTASGVLLTICVAYAIFCQTAGDSIRDHSVPLFALGVITSNLRNNGLQRIVTLIITIGIITSIFGFTTTHPLTNTLHSFFDYAVVATMVIVVSVKKYNWRLTPWLSAILFDVYLVHFKIFTLASQYLSWPLWLFLAAAIPASFTAAYIFMRLRTSAEKLLRLQHPKQYD